MSEKKDFEVTCPSCKTKFMYYSKKTRPFCSDRCKDHDFLDWTEESHRIPSNEKLNESDLEVVIKSRENGLH